MRIIPRSKNGIVILILFVAVMCIDNIAAVLNSRAPAKDNHHTAVQTVKTTAPAAKPGQDVEYVVTGSTAYVNYGPTGTTFSGTSPMDVTRKLGDPAYYVLWAQLQNGGRVTVKILINGKVIARDTVAGGSRVAEVEIDKDPFTGKWEDGKHPTD